MAQKRRFWDVFWDVFWAIFWVLVKYIYNECSYFVFGELLGRDGIDKGSKQSELGGRAGGVCVGVEGR